MSIPFSDFKKLEFKIGTIRSAERIEGSEKLLKLTVDLTSETRQVIAGIGRIHAPENLIDTQCAFIVNLEPRMLMGLESQGMLLAASDENGNPVLLRPEKEVASGTPIQ
ncbi:MAG: methionine--tRNA ligase [bacterium]|nr:methionine--tRNA ligase [bacterium]